jgi:hypothetical protein
MPESVLDDFGISDQLIKSIENLHISVWGVQLLAQVVYLFSQGSMNEGLEYW